MRWSDKREVSVRALSWVAAVSAALLLLVPPSGAAGNVIRALMTIAVRGAVEELLPAFEKASGDKVVATWATSALLNERIRKGEVADLLISTRAGIDDLIKTGRVAAGSDADIARVGVGVAVRKGSPRPDISTPEAFKRALLAAKAVGYSDPAAGGVSGVHVAKALERLGIASELKAKSRFPPPSGLSAALLVTGEVDLAIQQISELVSVDGVEVIGPLPGDLQLVTTFTAGVPAAATHADVGRALIGFLRSAHARAILATRGLDAPADSAR
jgi:molybdate transport system substrate-binding protein